MNTELEKIIVIGKFNPNLNFLNDAKKHKNERCRLSSKNPNLLKNKVYTIISCNKEFVLFNKETYKLRDFCYKIKKDNLLNLIVLTKYEKDLLLDLICEFEIKIEVFEELFPFFDYIFYNKKISKNIKKINNLISVINENGIIGASANQYLTTKYRFLQERKLRFKSSLDNFIYFSCYPAYQEVFKAKDTRQGRKIYALDFNSMYLSCMEGNYPNPKNLKYVSFDNTPNIENLHEGFYRVTLKNAKETQILKYLPYKYSNYLSSHLFQFMPGMNIHIFLAKPELLQIKKYFNDIQIIDGIISKSHIEHPLLKHNIKTFKERQLTKNSFIRNFNKYSLVVSSSISQHKKYIKRIFDNEDSCVKYLEFLFFLEPKHTTLSNELKLKLFESKGLIKNVKKDSNSLNVCILDFNNDSSIYCLYSYMLSKSRVKIIKLIEEINKIYSTEICYVNVDSIHVSVNINKESELIDLINKYPKDELGGIKIEATANQGYWLDIGRYWLFNDSKLQKHKNFYFNWKHSINPYQNFKIKYERCSIYGLNYIKKTYLKIENTFSYTKKIQQPIKEFDNISLNRYSYEDVIETSVAQFNIFNERISSLPDKQFLFNELSTVKCSYELLHKF